MNQSKKHIAIAVSADGETVWDDHFGEAPRFYIFDTNGQLIDKRDNPYWQQDHEFHTGPKRMVDLLPECGVFIARAMGDGRRTLPQKHGVQPFLTIEINIKAALQAYLASSSR